MALYHATIKVATKAQKGGMRASAHYAYICRSGAFENLRTVEELISVESGNLPSWAADDPSIFWLASDTFERENGSVYRELEAALPRELSGAQQRELVQGFIDAVLGIEHPYTLAIHDKIATDGLRQPHIHLMWSERKLDGIARDPAHFFKRAAAARKGKNGEIKKTPDASAGGCRKISMGTRLEEFRELWASLTNTAYTAAGLEERVSHLSLAAQGIERTPEPHLGPTRMSSKEGATLLVRRRLIKASEETRTREAEAAEIAEAEAMKIMEMLARERVIQTRIQELLVTIPPKLKFTKTQSQEQVFDKVTSSLGQLQDHKPNFANNRPKLRAYSPEMLKARRYRAEILLQRYGSDSEMLARFWRIKTVPARREIVYEQRGARIVDKGALITADHGNVAEINAMIEIALLKKWNTIVFSGNDEFKLEAMVRALRANLNVQPADENDLKLLERAKGIAARDDGNGGNISKGGAPALRRFKPI